MPECFACGEANVAMVKLNGRQIPACGKHRMLAMKVMPQQGVPCDEGSRRRPLARKVPKVREAQREPKAAVSGRPTRRKLLRAAEVLINVANSRGRLGRPPMPDDVIEAVKDLQGAAYYLSTRTAGGEHVDQFNRAAAHIAAWVERVAAQ